jgi:hypothetical protein
MKNLLVVLTLIFGFTLTSCHKEEVTPPNTLIEEVETISVFGEWLLVDGKMYMENLETGEKTVYDHFGPTKSVSSLRYDGYMFEFERIVVDSTLWTFTTPYNIPGTGQFWLDNDSIQPYGFYVTDTNMTIVENSVGVTQLGGSARPITAFIDEDGTNSVNFFVQEAYESINGVNYKYFSELTFQKQ